MERIIRMDDDDTTVEETVQTDDSSTQETVDYEKQYKDTQAWGTQQSQKAAQLEAQLESLKTDPEAQRQFLTDLGYELEEVEDDEGLDPDELVALRKEVEQIKAQAATQQQDAEAQRQIASWEAQEAREFTEFGEQRGFALTEKEKEAIRRQAVALGVRDDGSLPFREAVEALDAVWSERQAQWAKGKQPSHRVSAGGRQAETKPDLSTWEKKRDHAMSLMNP